MMAAVKRPSGWSNGAETQAWTAHRKPWERAPWWARVFGFKWRRMTQEAHGQSYGPTYEYQTTSRRAREFLKEQFDAPATNLTATELAERFKNLKERA